MNPQMPGMGGLQALEAIARERPTPTVVISERSSGPGADPAYEALSRGALELVAAAPRLSPDVREIVGKALGQG